MRIQQINQNNTNNPVLNQNSELKALSLNKNDIIKGKIISVEGKNITVLTLDNKELKAVMNSEINLPINSDAVFTVIDNTNSTVILRINSYLANKLVLNSESANLLNSISIKPSDENINFLEKKNIDFGKNLDKIITLLNQNETKDVFQGLMNIVVNRDNIYEYLKKFDKSKLENILEELNDLLKGIKNDENTKKMYKNVFNDILKGLYLQIKNDFPLYYIPIPIYINNQLYNGEVWVEEDKENNNKKDIINIYFSVDTKTIGRIEAVLINFKKDLKVTFKCEDKYKEILQEVIPNLKNSIENIGFDIKDIDIVELKENTTFLKIAQKYTKPFTPIDIKV